MHRSSSSSTPSTSGRSVASSNNRAQPQIISSDVPAGSCGSKPMKERGTYAYSSFAIGTSMSSSTTTVSRDASSRPLTAASTARPSVASIRHAPTSSINTMPSASNAHRMSASLQVGTTTFVNATSIPSNNLLQVDNVTPSNGGEVPLLPSSVDLQDSMKHLSIDAPNHKSLEHALVPHPSTLAQLPTNIEDEDFGDELKFVTSTVQPPPHSFAELFKHPNGGCYREMRAERDALEQDKLMQDDDMEDGDHRDHEPASMQHSSGSRSSSSHLSHSRSAESTPASSRRGSVDSDNTGGGRALRNASPQLALAPVASSITPHRAEVTAIHRLHGSGLGASLPLHLFSTTDVRFLTNADSFNAVAVRRCVRPVGVMDPLPHLPEVMVRMIKPVRTGDHVILMRERHTDLAPMILQCECGNWACEYHLACRCDNPRCPWPQFIHDGKLPHFQSKPPIDDSDNIYYVARKK